MKTKEIIVKPKGGREYPIRIGAGAVKSVAVEARAISKSCRALVVTDKNVAKFHIDTLMKSLRAARIDAEAEIIPSGERYKNFSAYQRLISRLASIDDTRDTIVIAFGGGVVGDLAGFAAASYRRGIPLIQVPTTLLSCVDSSVGGKTGFDLPEGKNLVGAFYQPRAVVADLDFLITLPKRELRAGMAEVIKYGFIMDAPFVSELESEMDKMLELDREAMAAAVERCCRLKAKVVAADERDDRDIRAILNFGHTFAHAIEAACGYRNWRHGEAVGVGMVCAADLSVILGLLKSDDAERIERLVIATGLPVTITGAKPDELLEFMTKDKKTKGGKLRFILLNRIGRAFVSDTPGVKDIKEVLNKRIY
ncbi:MAG: 3-dehydroquinate synthase [bacterium]